MTWWESLLVELRRITLTGLDRIWTFPCYIDEFAVLKLCIFDPSLIQWTGHSDPEKLKEKAKDVQRLSGDELKKRQLEIKVRISFHTYYFSLSQEEELFQLLHYFVNFSLWIWFICHFLLENFFSCWLYIMESSNDLVRIVFYKFFVSHTFYCLIHINSWFF